MLKHIEVLQFHLSIMDRYKLIKHHLGHLRNRVCSRLTFVFCHESNDNTQAIMKF